MVHLYKKYRYKSETELYGRLIRRRRMGAASEENEKITIHPPSVMRMQPVMFLPILITIFVTAMDSQYIIFHPCYILCQKNETSFMPSAFLPHTPPRHFMVFFTDCI